MHNTFVCFVQNKIYDTKKKNQKIQENIKTQDVHSDTGCKWNAHTNNVIIKLRKLHYLFINARQFLNAQVFRMIYFTQTILKYGITT